MGRLDQFITSQNIKNLIFPIQHCVKEIEIILEEVGIREKLYTRVGELSGGQKQRVAVARALYHGRKILLADEPISSVDPHRADELLSKIINSANTVVISIHNIQLAIKFTNRLIGIRDGKIIFDDLTKNITKDQFDNLYTTLY